MLDAVAAWPASPMRLDKCHEPRRTLQKVRLTIHDDVGGGKFGWLCFLQRDTGISLYPSRMRLSVKVINTSEIVCFVAPFGSSPPFALLQPGLVLLPAAYIFTPRALTSPFSPIFRSTRQSGQYHLVVRAGTAVMPTHSKWNHSCLQFWPLLAFSPTPTALMCACVCVHSHRHCHTGSSSRS